MPGNKFIDQPQDSFEEAAAVCESNFQIMGEESELGDDH